jgi:superfamily II DNA/RNA helicase
MSETFAELGVSKALVSALRDRGVTAPFAVQRLVLADALDGRDVLVQSPTGSGKTLAFAIPIVQRLAQGDACPAALVLAPTRELAQQILAEAEPLLHARGLRGTSVYGGAGLERQAKLARRAQLVVATPGRLIDLIERRSITLDQVRMLVLDEADRMLDMGFRPAVDRIVRELPRERQTLFFSATLAGQIGQLASAYTRNPRRHELAATVSNAPAIEHRFVLLSHSEKIDALVSSLRADSGEQTLVFVRTKRGADRLVKRLRAHNLEAVAMHGDKTQGQRERALAQFERGDVNTLVATDVAARGIDVTGIGHVINFDVPPDRDTYVHRVGRTGRAGEQGASTTFVLHEQAGDVRKIAQALQLQRELQAAFAGGHA